jgi:hypothetical protein
MFEVSAAADSSFGDYVSPNPFAITQDLLNDILANITLSAISLGVWSETTDVSQNLTSTVYHFAHPLNIALPYSLVFGLTLPFLVLGLWSLYANGVHAQDGGFFQLLVTTSGSERLRSAAARNGCLGNVPEEIKSLEVQFGELIETEAISRDYPIVGFSIEDEVMMIKKGKIYGPCNGGDLP